MTIGSAAGSIRDLFAKVKTINAKHGKFDLVLCTGDFFGQPKAGEQVSEDEDETTSLLNENLEGVIFYIRVNLIELTISNFAAPLEFYIMQGEHPLPSNVIEKFAKTGGELCKNVFLMSVSAYCFSPLVLQFDVLLIGKSGLITTANGLRIACLGGTYDPEIYDSAEAAPVRLLELCF